MKPKLLFRAPVLTASGYGVHSRQLLKALLATDVFDISAMTLGWGQTPFLTDRDDPFVEQVRKLSVKRELEAQNNTQYDISVQVTIPNEFEKMARLNIGVTAGIETDRVSPEWIKRANEQVDLLVVPSVHSAQSFAGPQYKNAQGETLKLLKSVTVCPEGVDIGVFNTDPLSEEAFSRFDFKPKFCFLSVGLGFDKGLGEDRKNMSTLVKWFLEKFKGDPDVGLVLKTSIVGNSLLDFEMVSSKIRELRQLTGVTGDPKIYLVHGRLSDSEMAALYKHPNVKAYVTFTHGEGFGLPILEAAACGLPVMATNWSGHIDFLKIGDKKKFVSLEAKAVEIPKAAVWPGVMEEGSRWADVIEEDAKTKMKKIVLSYEKPKEWATDLAAHVRKIYQVEKVSYAFANEVVKFYNSQGPALGAQSIDQIAVRLKKELGEPDSKTLLYTMPMSAGDVYISTAVVDSLKKKFPEHKLFFATDQKYAQILKGNPNIYKVIPFHDWMMNVPLCELVFDEVYTPNLSIQTTAANWVRGGKGRLLGNEMAAQCQVDFGEYFIETEAVEGLPETYVCLHPGSGKGQWEARNYLHWQEVVNNVKKLGGIEVVQVGLPEDPLYEGCLDFRGKSASYNQLAHVVKNASVMVGIDSVTTHLAAGLGTPHVALYGSSYSTSTGPVNSKKTLSVLLDTPSRYTCEKACYKYECFVDKEHPCVNEISPRKIVEEVLKIGKGLDEPSEFMQKEYREHRSKIVGYTHVFNAASGGYPYVQSIKSMLGFCDSVIVVDGGSKDGTVEKIRAIQSDRIQLMEHEWDWEEPGMDGMQKAFGRAMATVGPNDFLWQQDADEVVHEEDYERIRDVVKRFPKDMDLLHLPVIELWGSHGKVRTDRHSWKWRLSRNNFRLTHGINAAARVVDEKTGKTFARRNMSDGCEYVDIMTGEFIPHRGFYTSQLEFMRINDPQAYGREMNRIFGEIPSVFHYSWADLPRKIRNFKAFWNRCWSNLYNDPAPVDRFPDVNTEEEILAKAVELEERGGEHGPAQTFFLQRSQPALMKESE